MRILFPFHEFIRWNGGLDMARLLAAAMRQQQDAGRIDLSFAMPRTSPWRRTISTTLRAWNMLRADIGIQFSSPGGPGSLARVADQMTAGSGVAQCADSSSGIISAASSRNADVIFPSMLPLGPTKALRAGYVTDFQHKHLPQLFPHRMLQRRDAYFRRLADGSDIIVANSRSATMDVEKFLGVAATRILALPFTPYCRPEWLQIDPAPIARKYGIAAPYIMVCNHFWKHKDHSTAIRAFAKLAERSQSPLFLVMTGDPVDHRDPAHYATLLSLISRLGIKSRVLLPGLIPKSDQIGLLRGACMLWQPTLFEGGPGGGSTYEAIGLGTPAVVSNIPINLEIDVGDIAFFEHGDPESLAKSAETLLFRQHQRPENATLITSSFDRVGRLGSTILNFFENAAKLQ